MSAARRAAGEYVAGTGWAAVNGRLSDRLWASGGAYLDAQPRGVYTVMRTVGRTSVLRYGQHVERIAQGLNEGGYGGGDVTPESVRAGLTPQLRDVVREAREKHPELRDAELRITVLMAPPELDRHLLVVALPEREEGSETFVCVARDHRENPNVKDSQWVAHAREVRAAMPPDAEEVVMVGDDGRLTEGLSSNFFAIVGGELRTASAAEVLPGTIRAMVLAACADVGVPVREEAPLLADAGTFEGALVSSTSRLALPIDRVVLPDGDGELRLPTGDGSPAARVAARVREMVLDESEAVL